MTTGTTKRSTGDSGRSTVSRRVVACLLAAWLGLGLQPCAIAADSAHDCPHCPPEDAPQMPAHHGHHAATTAGEESGCASMQTDCCDAAVAGVDARTGKLALKQGGEPPALVAPPVPVVAAVPWRLNQTTVDPPDAPLPSRPLHIVYCVYLD